MATIDVLDADGVEQVIERPLAPGRSAAATSRPVALSTEDKAVLDSLDTKLTTLAGYVDTLEALIAAANGFTDGLEALIAASNALLTTQAGYLDGVEGSLTTIASKDFSTQTTLASVLAKIIAAPATEAKQDTGNTSLSSIDGKLTTQAAYLDGLEGFVDGLEGKLDTLHNDLVAGLFSIVSAGAGGVASNHRLLSAAASTNAASVKASAGRAYKLMGYNAAAAVRYLKLYNKASAPTVGTDTPIITIALPPNTAFAIDWGNIGYYFATGIAYALTTGSADADTGALAAGDVLGLNLSYA